VSEQGTRRALPVSRIVFETQAQGQRASQMDAATRKHRSARPREEARKLTRRSQLIRRHAPRSAPAPLKSTFPRGSSPGFRVTARSSPLFGRSHPTRPSCRFPPSRPVGATKICEETRKRSNDFQITGLTRMHFFAFDSSCQRLDRSRRHNSQGAHHAIRVYLSPS